MLKMTGAMQLQAVGLFANNTDTLWHNADDWIKLHWIIQPFTPSPDLVIGDLTLGESANGLGGISLTKQIAHFKYVLGHPKDLFLRFLTPSLGFIAQPTGGFPVTIYGAALLGNNDTDLYAVEAFDPPWGFAEEGPAAFFDRHFFTFPAAMFS